MKKALLASIGAVLFAAGTVAQDEQQKVTPPEALTAPVTRTNDVAASAGKITAFNRVSAFLNMPVKSAEGRELGKVQDLAIDASKGQIGYAVLALSGNGAVARSVAVPISALKASESGQAHLVLNMSEPVLAASAGLAEDEWPAVDTFAVGGPAEAESGSGSSESQPAQADPK